MADETTDLLERAYRGCAEAFDAVAEAGLSAATPCTGWTVRDVANHLVSVLGIFARIVEGEQIDPAEFSADDEKDLIGADPAAAYRFAAERCLAAFRRPGALDQVYPFVFGPTSGRAIAGISMSEALVHGWDIANAIGVGYRPDDAVVAAVTAMQSEVSDEDRAASGMFAPARPVPPDATPFNRLLGLLGRTAAS